MFKPFLKDAEGSNKTEKIITLTLNVTNNSQTHSIIYARKGRVCVVVIYANHRLLTAHMLVTSVQIIFHHKIHVWKTDTPPRQGYCTFH